jgi:hypothetical protein
MTDVALPPPWNISVFSIFAMNMPRGFGRIHVNKSGEGGEFVSFNPIMEKFFCLREKYFHRLRRVFL